MKNITKILGITLATSLLIGCGSAEERKRPIENVLEDVANQEDEPVAEEDEASVEAPFGARMLSDYPISGEAQASLETLDSSYKKVNWTVAYAPSDNGNIVVSETMYNFEGNNHLVVAFTNLSDEGVTLSYEGYAENTSDEVAKDLLESDVELGPKNTIARDINFNQEVPSGNFNWKKFDVKASTEGYAPYEISSELKQDSSGDYSIISTFTSEEALFHLDKGYGFVLDENGNIILGAMESSNNSVYFYTDSFGGENEDYVYYVNLIMHH